MGTDAHSRLPRGLFVQSPVASVFAYVLSRVLRLYCIRRHNVVTVSPPLSSPAIKHSLSSTTTTATYSTLLSSFLHACMLVLMHTPPKLFPPHSHSHSSRWRAVLDKRHVRHTCTCKYKLHMEYRASRAAWKSLHFGTIEAPFCNPSPQ